MKRFYKSLGVFKKEYLFDIIGKDKAEAFFDIFYLDDILDDFINSAYSKHEEFNNYEINSYHIFVGHYNIKIGDYSDKIKKINEEFGFDNTDVDNWLRKNSNKYIYWIGFTLNKDKKKELTYYIRETKHNSLSKFNTNL